MDQTLETAKDLVHRTRGRNVKYIAKNIQQGLVDDVDSVVPCEVDAMLKYFLYLSLKPAEKARLDELQDHIEAIEKILSMTEDRDPRVINPKSLEGGTSKGLKPNATVHNEKAGKGINADPEIIKLVELRQERDARFQLLFDQCMDGVIGLCKDEGLAKLLTEYACQEMRHEAQRYAPYALATNHALNLLKLVHIESFREPATLDIRFHCDDTRNITSHYEGLALPIQNKSGVIVTSLVATQGIMLLHPSKSTFNYENLSEEAFPGRSFLSYHECKMKASKILSRLPIAYSQTYRGSEFVLNPNEIPLHKPEINADPAEPPDLEEPEADMDVPARKRIKLDIYSSSGSKTDNNSSREARNIAAKCRYRLSVVPGVHHAITCSVVDDKIWVIYDDCQGIIHTHGMDFIKNLPRFLMLLFAFQRFELEDWAGPYPQVGIAPYDSSSLRAHTMDGRASMEGDIDKNIKAQKELWVKHYRSTPLFGGTHSGSTNRIRSMTSPDSNGGRTLRVMQRLCPITELRGEAFIKAWFEIVVCHALLWDMGIHHRDPSLGNLLCEPGTGKGVLLDFDLAVPQDTPQHRGHGRIGSVPFMAIDLLANEYRRGQTQRLYYHGLETLIWVLPFVLLRYPNGETIKRIEADDWVTSSISQCLKLKLDFWSRNHLTQIYIRVTDSEAINTWKKEWRLVATLVNKAFRTNDEIDSKKFWMVLDGIAPSKTLGAKEIHDQTKSVRKGFIDVCRDRLVDEFPYILEYLDKFEGHTVSGSR